MASPSTRPTRKSSRRSSPFVGRHGLDPPVPPVEPTRTATPQQTLMDEWIEPEPRAGAPSFQDYKGIERQGVLLGMQPLGQLPPTKNKAKGKAEGPKRLLTFKRAEAAAAAAKELASTPESSDTPTLPARRSESRRNDESARRALSARASVSQPASIKKQTPAPAPSRPSTVRSSSAQSVPGVYDANLKAGLDSSAAQAKFKLVVEAAVLRAAQLNCLPLGNALKQLYEDSFRDPALAELLTAILNKNATLKQNEEFQNYVRIARRHAKGGSSSSSSQARRAASASTSTPPIASSAKSTHKSHHPSTNLSGPSRVVKGSHSTSHQAVSSHDSEPARRGKGVVAARARNGVATRRSLRQSPAVSESSALSSLDSPSPITDVDMIDAGEGFDGVGGAHDEMNGAASNHQHHQHHPDPTETPVSRVSTQPITSVASSPTVGPKLHTFSTTKTSTTTTSSTTNPDSISSTTPRPFTATTGNTRNTSHPSSNPAATPNTSTTTTAGHLHHHLHPPSITASQQASGHKRKSSVAGLDLVDDDDDGDEDEVDDENEHMLAAKRTRYEHDLFRDVPIQASHLRPHLDEPQPSRSFVASRISVTTPSSRPSSTRPSRLRNGTAKSLNSGYEADDRLLSPTRSATATDAPPPPAGAALDDLSRPGTPTLQGRSSRKTKKTARVKMSPMKKKSGVIAGIGRVGPHLESPIGVGPGHVADRLEDDNEDFCSACSGQGGLLCCDGCDRSFHFTCLDPPMKPDDLPEQWFCFKCLARRHPMPKYARGLFSAMLNDLEKKNPISFRLPAEIRNYFEGVKTNEDGEYEEVTVSKPKNRSGYDEATDLLKLKDNKGKYILCFRCGKSALDRQEILPCDFCSLHWHLDCVDPPMANPPPREPNGKQRNTWMCPNHVQHELLGRDPSSTKPMRGILQGIRTHKIRRPKNAKIVDVALRRGFKNNGLIEIENEASEDEGFEDTQHFGTVYRLPERGIKLDFISKIKKSRSEAKGRSMSAASASASQQRRAQAAAEQLKADFDRRSFLERKAALNLVQFAQVQDDLDLGTGQIDNLLDALIAEAPAEVVAALSETPAGAKTPTDKSTSDPVTSLSTEIPSPPSSDSRPEQLEQGVVGDGDREKKMLLALQELIRRKLDGIEGEGASA